MDELEDPVYDTVNFLREQRMYMVQSEAQYHFIYSILKDRYLSIRKSASPPPSGRATPAPTEAAVEAVPPPLPPVEVGDATGALAGDETMTGTEPVAA